MAFLRQSVALGALLPVAFLSASCSDGGDAGASSGGTSSSGGTTSSSAGGVTSSGGASSNSAGGVTATAGGSAAHGGSTSSAGTGGAKAGAGGAGASGTSMGPAAVDLGSSAQYAVLAESAISNVPSSAITGDLGLSPAAASYITGFSLIRAGTKWTSADVVGSVFAADNDAPTPSDLTTAVSDMQTAYTDAAGRLTPDFLELGAGAIGGLTLAPGLYKWGTSLTIPTDVTLAGSKNDTWIFQVAGDLVMSAATRMALSGGAAAKNIVWQVAGSVAVGTGAHVEGIVLSKTAIGFATGASINGRLLAQTAVTLDSATVSAP